ncbi:extensin family protein [uncultured Sulfitobacter sp.]|uniref:extensin-like domain-containing protein n=1 Tax=uncultured Sulfitobacter sp. TaxID=191468 RepID=UPI00261E4E56|nr:extensin family protein [uncultured Sulfitobacter sp.]
MTPEPNRKRRPVLRWAAFFVVLGVGIWQALVHPRSPLPEAWNPLVGFDLSQPETLLTRWKMARALADPQACLAALETGAIFEKVADLEESAQCHIRPQVILQSTATARMQPLNTRCQTALRLAAWDRYGIQPAAREHLGTGVRRINHLSSYNCRAMRTTGSGAPRMSTHATADAVDIAGVTLDDGRQIRLIEHWTGQDARAAFLRDIRDSSCTWFRVTLGPEYNRLHADHFHLQHTGWGLCR